MGNLVAPRAAVVEPGAVVVFPQSNAHSVESSIVYAYTLGWLAVVVVLGPVIRAGGFLLLDVLVHVSSSSAVSEFVSLMDMSLLVLSLSVVFWSWGHILFFERFTMSRKSSMVVLGFGALTVGVLPLGVPFCSALLLSYVLLFASGGCRELLHWPVSCCLPFVVLATDVSVGKLLCPEGANRLSALLSAALFVWVPICLGCTGVSFGALFSVFCDGRSGVKKAEEGEGTGRGKSRRAMRRSLRDGEGGRADGEAVFKQTKNKRKKEQVAPETDTQANAKSKEMEKEEVLSRRKQRRKKKEAAAKREAVTETFPKEFPRETEKAEEASSAEAQVDTGGPPAEGLDLRRRKKRKEKTGCRKRTRGHEQPELLKELE